MKPFAVVFVCTGNICRSPMAEGILKDLLLDEAARHSTPVPVKVISAGTHACEGCGASDNAIQAAREAGINLNHHISRPFNDEAAGSDLILTMERNHLEFIRRTWPGLNSAHELKRFGRATELVPRVVDIEDPIGSSLTIYREVFNEIRDEVARVAPLIIELAKKRENAR